MSNPEPPTYTYNYYQNNTQQENKTEKAKANYTQSANN